MNLWLAKKSTLLVYYPMILTHCPFVPTPHSEDWDPNDLGSKTYKGDENTLVIWYLTWIIQ